MPRQPRRAVPEQPHHVIQRGNNRTSTFTTVEEYDAYVDWLTDALERFDCRVHAYVLMTNHVHLLITPFVSGGIGRVMQSVGRRYVCYFNKRHCRTGTLWEGRYRASAIGSDRYLMTCYRYIELNPVRAGLSKNPAGYTWSSHTANALGIPDKLVSPHPLYLALGSSSEARRAAYEALFRDSIEPDALEFIRRAVHTQWPIGGASYRSMLETRSKWQPVPPSIQPPTM
jgi:putative transposase